MFVEAPATGIVPRKSGQRRHSFTTDTAKRARNNSAPSRLSLSRSRTAISADSLADVQAELDAVPLLSVSPKASGAAIQHSEYRLHHGSVLSYTESDGLVGAWYCHSSADQSSGAERAEISGKRSLTTRKREPKAVKSRIAVFAAAKQKRDEEVAMATAKS